MAGTQLVQPPLDIPDITLEGWQQQLLQLFPLPWTGDIAKAPGGILYALMGACAANLQMINDFLIYGFDASRIATATNGELDLVADDFYGINGLPRQAGESDTSYRMRIQAGLFIPYTTKQAFIQAITALTGIAPRLIEPWNPVDTSAYDWSFYDADYPPLRPSLYGDPSLIYQGFIIATLPTPSIIGPTNIWGYDLGAGYDIFTGVYWNLQAANFVGPSQVDALIQRIKAFGITIWRKYLNEGTMPFPIPNSYMVATGLTIFNISIQPFNGTYIVIASANWNSILSVSNIAPSSFTITPSTVTPSGANLSYVILPTAFPGTGYVAITPGATSCTVPIPAPPSTAGQQIACTPSWNTTTYISAIDDTITISFGTVAPAGAVLYYYFAPAPSNSFVQPIAEGLTTLSITVPGMPLGSCGFITPSWNTQVSIQVVANGMHVGFNVASPADAYLHVTYFPPTGS